MRYNIVMINLSIDKSYPNKAISNYIEKKNRETSTLMERIDIEVEVNCLCGTQEVLSCSFTPRNWYQSMWFGHLDATIISYIEVA